MSAATQNLVLSHYQPADGTDAFLQRIDRLLDDLGGGPLAAAQLAALDQFHTRGLAATAELARCLALTPQTYVLDAGSGLGGPSRFLAESHGCQVVGVDLTPAFVELSRRLALRSNAADLLQYVVGDVCDLPMEDGHFDLVWTQHVLMNVHDRAEAYAEFHRVLKPGGRLACYDMVWADHKPAIEFPVPWASGPGASHLLTHAETAVALDQAGFDLLQWENVTELVLSGLSQAGPPASQGLSLAVVMGPRMQVMAGNLVRNLRENRVRVAMSVHARRAV
ncbi:MAG: class I SAM-dependent methyltransferase [Rhizobacter sp.]